MKRIILIGCGGSGKSTLAKEMGMLLNLPVIFLDKHFWRPGWVPTSSDEWEIILKKFLSRDSWIMDGNFNRTMEMRMEAADTVIFFDFPRWLCFWRVTKRILRYYNKTRPDMAEGCRERLDKEFTRWIWRYNKYTRPVVLNRINNYCNGKEVYILRNPKEVRIFLAKLKKGNLSE